MSVFETSTHHAEEANVLGFTVADTLAAKTRAVQRPVKHRQRP